MTVTSNINSELADGFQGYTDIRKITVNSTVDVGVSGSLTAVLGQVGSSFGLRCNRWTRSWTSVGYVSELKRYKRYLEK